MPAGVVTVTSTRELHSFSGLTAVIWVPVELTMTPVAGAELLLNNGVRAPVSRTYAGDVRRTSWAKG